MKTNKNDSKNARFAASVILQMVIPEKILFAFTRSHSLFSLFPCKSELDGPFFKIKKWVARREISGFCKSKIWIYNCQNLENWAKQKPWKISTSNFLMIQISSKLQNKQKLSLKSYPSWFGTSRTFSPSILVGLNAKIRLHAIFRRQTVA